MFSLDPLSAEAHITLYVSGQEVASLDSLRRLETLCIVRRGDYEGLELTLVDAKHDPLRPCWLIRRHAAVLPEQRRACSS